MRIGIDARQITHGKRHGLRTYVENLVTHLTHIDKDNEYFLYIDSKEAFNLDLSGSSFKIRILPWRLKYVSTILNDYVLLPHQVRKDKIDVFHFPAYPLFLNKKVRTVITVHDALPFMAMKGSIFNRNIFETFHYLMTFFLLKLSAGSSDCIITISKKSKEDLIGLAGFRDIKMKVIHEAANEHFKPLEKDENILHVKEKYHLGDHFILGFVHKNGDKIVQAYNKLPSGYKNRYRVGLICQKQDFPLEIKKILHDHDLKSRVKCIPPVTEAELVALYNAAALFLFPSYYEGFGLPVIEAMKCGCPVICSNRGSLPEVAGDAALYIHELDVHNIFIDELEKKIELILSDRRLKEKLIDKGLQQSKKYSWKMTAEKTLKVYKENCSPRDE